MNAHLHHRLYILVLVLPLMIGCAKTAFSGPDEGSNVGKNDTPPPIVEPVPPPSTSIIKDQTVVTQMNTPISFTAALIKDDGLAKQLVFPNNLSVATSASGVLEIINAGALEFRYTPNTGFRGTDKFAIYLSDSNGTISSATLTVDVANALSTIQPSLATRTTGCIMCHASVASNIITDFGYGGDGKGLNYFFGGVAGVLPSGFTNAQGESMYGDYDFSTGGNVNWGSAHISNSAKVIVPMAPTTGINVPQSSLAEYLRSIFSHPSAASRNVPVEEVNSLYIGAPNAQRIREAAGLATPETFKFMPETTNSPALSGLELHSSGNYYVNNGPLICNGDLTIDGVVWLNNLQVETDTGCRLYVTKSVFITGTIGFNSNHPLRNMQISSSRAILLGIGKTCNGSAHSDSHVERLTTTINSRFNGAFTRDLGTPTEMLSLVKGDSDTIPGVQDATCGPTGRNVSYERLLLNAPMIQSRYQGAFSGTMISEITLTSLNSLIYAFDPVFSKTVILPLLKPQDYLTINP